MNLTATQRIIFNLLLDGQLHTKEEIRTHLKDELLENNTISAHVYLMRKRINKEGYDVVSRSGRFQMVRLLHSAYDGER